MANTGINVPDDVLDAFDRKIAEKEATGDFPTNTPRTKVIQALMVGWIEGNFRCPETPSTTTVEPTVSGV